MRNLSYILLAVLLFGVACKEPDVNSPETDRTLTEKISYEILGQDTAGFAVESITEAVIRSRGELSNFLSANAVQTSLPLMDKMLKVDYDKHFLVIISARNISEDSRISIDSIYLTGNGDIQIDYRIYQKNGLNAKVHNPTLAVLIKNHKEAVVKFKHKIEIDGQVPDFSGFQTIATDLSINSRRKWKAVFASPNDVAQWASEFGANNLWLLDSVDFTKEMIISVGVGYLGGVEGEYRITDIKQRGNRLIVSSTFHVEGKSDDKDEEHNHFVKIKRTNLPIEFSPTQIVNDNPEGDMYYAPYGFVNVQSSTITSGTVSKASNLAELFATIEPKYFFNGGNAEADFEFFDLLIVKSPTSVKSLYNYAIKSLDNKHGSIEGKVIFYQNAAGSAPMTDTYLLIGILKTQLEISDKFEVILK
jgi:hypothetical protein